MGSILREQSLHSQSGFIGSENPQHYVRMPSFAAGRYAVTKGEFASFVRASGYRTEAEQRGGCLGTNYQKVAAYNWRNVGFAQGNDHPVVCVSWNDAQAYIQWLNQSSGGNYRLLSDAEREYAARGGTQTAFWWGENINVSQANYTPGYSWVNGAQEQDRKATVPVNSFSANRFGLHNVHGNVQEWTQDCWHEDYTGAPIDGSAWITGCNRDNLRVIRGGAWGWSKTYTRSASRVKFFQEASSYTVGFRLAKTLFAP